MTVTPVRVGWLGAGLIATFHSKMLHGSGADAVWAGVYDPDTTRAERFASDSGATVCDSVEDVLDGCDAVYVCTWTSTHLELVRAALERKLPVFCEKPLATDLATARLLAEEVQASGVVNQVGLILRRSPAFMLVRELVAEEASGGLVSFVFRDDQYLPTGGMYASTWRGEKALAGAGTLLEHSIHDVDLIEAVLGPVASVTGDRANIHGLDGIEDVVSATLRLRSGAVGSLTSIWHDIDARPSTRRLEVFCRFRHLELEGDWFGPVTCTEADGTQRRWEGSELLDEATARGIDHEIPDGAFVRAVQEGSPAHPDVTVALRAHVLVDAIYHSCDTGAAVTV